MDTLKTIEFHGSIISKNAISGIESVQAASTELKEIRFRAILGGFDKDAAKDLANSLPDCKVYWDEELVGNSDNATNSIDPESLEGSDNSKK